ncbi:hypothetical protein RYX36_036474 [Vicia faba]
MINKFDVFCRIGFGHLLFLELKKRLQNVGIHIFCWGDKYCVFGAVTLEKSKVELSQQHSNKSSPEVVRDPRFESLSGTL